MLIHSFIYFESDTKTIPYLHTNKSKKAQEEKDVVTALVGVMALVSMRFCSWETGFFVSPVELMSVGFFVWGFCPFVQKLWCSFLWFWNFILNFTLFPLDCITNCGLY